MIIDLSTHPLKGFSLAGVCNVGGGCGIARCWANSCGDDGNIAGIYQRRQIGVGVTLAPRHREGHIGISRGAFYTYKNESRGGRIAWRAVFAAGKAQYDLLTAPQKAQYSKQARSLCMSGYNLFMSRWLQSHRS